MPIPFLLPYCMVCLSGGSIGIDLFAISDSIELVNRLASSNRSDRYAILHQLEKRPAGGCAVIWGSRQRDPDVANLCRDILQEWRDRRAEKLLKEFVRGAGGDFDRFINALLDERNSDSDPFKRVSDVGHAFNRFLGRTPMFRALRAEKIGQFTPVSPFDDFWDYLDIRKPTRINEPFWSSRLMSGAWLARTDRVLVKWVASSMVLCHGDVDIQECTNSIIIAGGDVRITHSGAAIIFASGDVALKMRAADVLVVAGGSVTYGQPTSNLLIVTPNGAVAAPKGHQRNVVVVSGSAKPDPELFTFPKLADYGIDAEFDQGRVHIRKVAPRSVLDGHLRNDDRITAAMGKKLESIGQFRRLVSLALDRGRFTCNLERGEDTIAVSAEVKRP